MTRRPGRGGQGYVSTRCPRSGTQAAMPRRARCGAGSLMTRCPRLGGDATAGGRHDAETAPIRGYLTCHRLVLHPLTSLNEGILAAWEARQRGES